MKLNFKNYVFYNFLCLLHLKLSLGLPSGPMPYFSLRRTFSSNEKIEPDCSNPWCRREETHIAAKSSYCTRAHESEPFTRGIQMSTLYKCWERVGLAPGLTTSVVKCINLACSSEQLSLIFHYNKYTIFTVFRSFRQNVS